MATRYCIIGASAAGIGAARRIVTTDSDAEIIIFETQGVPPLDKCRFVDVVAGDKVIDEIAVLQMPRQRDLIMPLIRPHAVVTLINTRNKSVQINDAVEYTYDKLLLACGTHAVVPSLFTPHIGNGSVFTFHSTEDLLLLLKRYPSLHSKSAVVIGSGLTGLELADALCQAGAHVTLLERSQKLFTGLSCDIASDAIAHRAATAGVRVVCESVITNVVQRADTMVLASDVHNDLVADVVFICTGQRPHTPLINQAGLKTVLGGVAVNNYLQTSDPDVYAAGDIAVVSHMLSQEVQLSTTWPDAMHQGMIAACNMMGDRKVYKGIVPAIHSSFFGYHFASLDAHLLEKKELILHVEKSNQGVTILGHMHGALRAYMHYGKTSLHAVLRRAVLTAAPIDDVCTEVLSTTKYTS